MNFKDSYLHEGLPEIFKVKLWAGSYPSMFQEGDRLNIHNYMPNKYDHHILLRRWDEQAIVSFQTFVLGLYERSDVIGIVRSYERSCHEDCVINLGGGQTYPPEMCKECSGLQLVEIMKGHVVLCCHTSSGLVKTNREWRDLHCARGGRHDKTT